MNRDDSVIFALMLAVIIGFILGCAAGIYSEHNNTPKHLWSMYQEATDNELQRHLEALGKDK